MKTQTCYFSLSNGLHGCYMPDNHSGPYSATTLREITSIIRDQLEWLEFPKNTFNQIKWRNFWHQAKRYGTSSIHFSIDHKGYELAFHGLTEAEYLEAEAAEDY